jgi:predicted secreted acid phosphatase
MPRFSLSLYPILLIAVAGSAPAAEPPNVDDLKSQLHAYHDYGEYDHDLAVVAAQAQDYVLQRAKQVTKPLLVLDVDETALSNWPEINANDFGFLLDAPCNALPKGPCGNLEWEKSGRLEAIAPTLTLFKAARAAGVTVIFITGRDETLQQITTTNLEHAGYTGPLRVITRSKGSSTESAADYKAVERARLEKEGYTIVGNVGDQPSDLACSFAEKNKPNCNHAERGFLLPNPFYRIP